MREYWYVKRKSDGLCRSNAGSWVPRGVAHHFLTRSGVYFEAAAVNEGIVVHVVVRPKTRGEPVGWVNRYEGTLGAVQPTKERADFYALAGRLECFPVYR